jgi:aminoglycoside phosphotransferase (APT) family kinase protein
VLPDRAIRWVTAAAGPGSRLVAARRLRPGGWHVNHAVDVAGGDGRIRRLVLRRWARPGWEADDPDYTVDREVRVLALLAGTPVPVPEVVAADPGGSRCDVPAILLTRLPGHPPRRADAEAEGFCRQLAQTLGLIHATGDLLGGTRPVGVPYRLYYDRERAEPARWMSGSRTWAGAVAAVREAPPPAVPTLIHRDYHPENTLWSRGRLTGVVDWTQASWGPPELDVAHMRWNLAADHGQQVADQFLACYRAITGRALEHQPYWDLVSLFDLLLDGDPDDPGDLGPDDQRRFEEYAEAALSRWRLTSRV